MIQSDVFELARVRAFWYDLHGLLKTPEAGPTNRPQRRRSFAARIAGAALAFNMATQAEATLAPSQMSLAWPTALERISPKQSLAESLKYLRTLKANWDGRNAVAPIERSISVAEYILPQLTDAIGSASAGVDADGHVFLRLNGKSGTAYVIVEPKAMHLLYMEPGKQNIYVDSEPSNGKILPAKIRKVLDEQLKA